MHCVERHFFVNVEIIMHSFYFVLHVHIVTYIKPDTFYDWALLGNGSKYVLTYKEHCTVLLVYINNTITWHSFK